MFTKLEQRSWIRIQVARGHSTQPPYRMIPCGEQHSSTLTSLLDADRLWTARELGAEIGVCHKNVLHILHDILSYRKLAARWIPHGISEVNNGSAMQSHRPC